ncbi:hypothetical protein ACS0TY_024636 [Phlomoides rotata]
MELLQSESVMCPVDQLCLQWAERYFGYCICNTGSGWFSSVLGLISVISWCVAEIPQIITNCKKKSAEGLSIVFLVTWILGDFFNVFGCILEPATLPTQYYVAVLYAITTSVLAVQALYYGQIYPRLKSNKRRQQAVQAGAVDSKEFNYDADIEKVSIIEGCVGAPSSPIPVASRSPKNSEELYFMSARYLSVSHMPTAGSLFASRSRRTGNAENWFNEPLLSEFRPSKSAPPTKIKTTLCVVSLMTFLLGSHNHLLAGRFENSTAYMSPRGGIVLPVGRQLLDAKPTRDSAQLTLADSSGIGTLLGWGMTAIYLGGRFPQIYLNIRRGHTEGLNPWMFVFAVVGNATYVASILVNSLEWSKLRPNLPWLVDSGGCVLLDVFILMQFILYRYRSRSGVETYVS